MPTNLGNAGALAGNIRSMGTAKNDRLRRYAEIDKGNLSPKVEDLFNQRKTGLQEQFDRTRQLVQGQKNEAMRQSENSLARFAAISGLGSGASEKAKQNALKDIQTGFGQVEAEVGSQQAQAADSLAAQEAQAREQSRQFNQTLQFQKDSFADQLQYQWAEFDENLKTNMLNAAIALKDAGLGKISKWQKLQGVIDNFYGQERSPDVYRNYTAKLGDNA